MKRKAFMSLILAVLLLLAALPSSAFAALAEEARAGVSRTELERLMDEADIPASASVEFQTTTIALGATENKTYAQELVSSNGDVLKVNFEFELRQGMTEAQWQTVSDWLKALVLNAVQQVQADPESLANVISEAYAAQRAGAQPGDTGMPAWASEDLVLRRITATVPYYPPLAEGIDGAATQRLQEKLIQLGFLNDRADGYYGARTAEAVMRLERYVQMLAQDDRIAEAQRHFALTTVAGSYADMPVATDELLETAEASADKAGDGSASALLQAYLFSDRFQPVRGVAALGDEGTTVSRVQTRLANLGYLAGEADGAFGSATAYSLRIFQYYNDLEQSGIADEATQRVLFSGRAVKPDNSMLTVGSSGDAVSNLQRRLRVLGFGSIAVDGSYGATTKIGVENLQQYMQQAGLMGGISDVNGIADPILLDAFYANSFPAIPAAMGIGSTGIDVTRVQRRLNCLEYYYSAVDGDYGEGTADAVKAFQKLNGLKQTGRADADTLAKLFNANAQKALKPYKIRVSREKQRVYVYALDDNLEYTELVKTMKCSTGRSGSETPKGTYTGSTGPGARWHFFKKFNCWAQYAYYIQGDIMFHSVLYGSKEGRVTQSSVNNLGRKASHGCVRLSVEDAKWIWTNCPARTTVVVE